MTVAIPIWPNKRLLIGAHIIGLKEPKLAIHSNITPGKLGPESEHILMLDYDGWSRENVMQRMEHECVFNYFLLPSEHGFHVVDTTRRPWEEMVRLQTECGDHDLHWRKTAQYGRAALAVHPYGGERVGSFSSRESLSHNAFYSILSCGANMDVIKAALSRGDIAFRFYRKYSFIKKVF